MEATDLDQENGLAMARAVNMLTVLFVSRARYLALSRENRAGCEKHELDTTN